jgi:ABC-type sugar transport system substrate-binding protein
MKNIFKNKIRIALVFGLVAAFLVSTTVVVNADVLTLAPKGNKKIRIGVLDLISQIEVAALANSLYIKEGKKRGWDVRVTDLKMNYAEAPNIMENMINAGYDAILVNWTDPKYYKDQVKKAFDKKIPIFTNTGGNVIPYLTADFGPSNYAFGAMSSEYMASKLKSGDKVLISTDTTVTCCVYRRIIAERVFADQKIKVVQQLTFTAGDPYQVGYDQVKNALTSDVNKEIKGIWCDWEGRGQSAARAAMDMKRPDIMVVSSDDSPMTYSYIRDNPTYHATSGIIAKEALVVAHMFTELDKLFAGKPFQTGTTFFINPYLVTKDNLPPKGYYYKEDGNYSGKPDFKVK